MSQLGFYTERGLGSSAASVYRPTTASLPQQQHFTENQSLGHQMKHVATSLTLFGPDSHEAIENTFPLNSTSDPFSHSNITITSQQPSTSSQTTTTTTTSGGGGGNVHSSKLPFQPDYTSWTDLNYHSSVYHSPISLHGYYRSCSVLSNSQSILPTLTRSVQHGTAMFGSGAYLHQYTTYGLELDEFITSFRYLGHVIQNYKGL